MVVRGPHLSLRFARSDDAASLYELGRDPEISRFFSWGPYSDPSEATAFIEQMRVDRKAGERLEFVIAGDDDRPIGITGLSEFSPRDARAVVGTWLGRRWWGSGANAEAKALVLALAFRTLGLQRVSAYASPDNGRSLRALEKLGFTAEGLLSAWHLHAGVRRDVVIHRLLREEWEQSAMARVEVSVEGVPPFRISAGNSVPA
jgi:[ribosomal protein S5]-alanine N-acetyltransferase